jgi:hypothetical protein
MRNGMRRVFNGWSCTIWMRGINILLHGTKQGVVVGFLGGNKRRAQKRGPRLRKIAVHINKTPLEDFVGNILRNYRKFPQKAIIILRRRK